MIGQILDIMSHGNFIVNVALLYVFAYLFFWTVRFLALWFVYRSVIKALKRRG